jgi:ferrous iron transport protein A
LKTLNQLGIREKAKISKINATGAIKKRIMDMGLTKGAVVEIKKIAPLGDPIEISVRNYSLALRRAEAGCIEVN